MLLKGESKSTKVLDEGVAWIMTDLLKSVVSRGIAGNAAISGVQVGGKTGTTNDTFDVWFDGFTPDYAAALWIGTDLNIEMLGSSAQAAALWSRIMRQVDGITDGEYLEMPSNVIKVNGEYYTSGTEKNAGKYTGKDSNKGKKKKDSNKNDNHNNNDNGGNSGGSGGGDSGSGSGGGDSGSGSGSGDSGGGSGDSGSGSGGSDSGGGSGDSGSSGGGDSAPDSNG